MGIRRRARILTCPPPLTFLLPRPPAFLPSSSAPRRPPPHRSFALLRCVAASSSSLASAAAATRASPAALCRRRRRLRRAEPPSPRLALRGPRRQRIRPRGAAERWPCSAQGRKHRRLPPAAASLRGSSSTRCVRFAGEFGGIRRGRSRPPALSYTVVLGVV
ncbi:hypothetical protein U9M48_023297 [Paspalum notatum var. saurae]|uniref:Uncharacterized protein n=1 Tax=Paspalum notatum var. saurae TaxID=547442 RepID=A0AAQ3WW01_PASNO